ncbi:hypothetical protein O0L34_g2313 [Tuta absoluta]|nr:hypothetical protein O0L34_g2313 [Tuta absoluta]
MSLVAIVEHDENIYRILEKPPPEPPRTPRYESKLEKQLKAYKIPQRCRTFGHAKTPMTRPDQFLKKGQGIVQPTKTSDHKCVSGNLPPVPKRPPPDKGPQKPTPNFRILNIKKAIKIKGKPVEPRLVDTRDGHIKKIKGSGEVPEFCLRPDFGQMPAYLLKRNRNKERRLTLEKIAEDNRESLCKLINKEERETLLANLKHNWALMQKAFLQLPMLTDTIPKIAKKTKMEHDLEQIEKDIKLVESNPYIYVYDEPK